MKKPSACPQPSPVKTTAPARRQHPITRAKLALWSFVAGLLTLSFLDRRRQNARAKRAAAERAIAAPERMSRGRDARAPGQIPLRGWLDVLARTASEFSRHRLMMVAAGVAFYVLLSIVPGLAALVSLYGLFTDPAQVSEQLMTLEDLLPPDVMAILIEQTNRIAAQPRESLSLGFALALGLSLWTANNGMKAIFDALNVVYEERESRNFFKLTAITLAFTLSMIVLMLLALSGIVVVPIVLSFVGLGNWAGWLLEVLRWPALFLLVAGAITLLYRVGPNRRPAQWRWLSWGSLTAAVLWLIASFGFSWYVANFGSYNEIYGSLGAVIAFMTWIWISALIVLLGGTLNAELEHQTAEDSTLPPPAPMGERGARMADTLGALRGEGKAARPG